MRPVFAEPVVTTASDGYLADLIWATTESLAVTESDSDFEPLELLFAVTDAATLMESDNDFEPAEFFLPIRDAANIIESDTALDLAELAAMLSVTLNESDIAVLHSCGLP
jgi:hypothetical protein